MEMCSRCHKRIAVLFITKIEGGETKNEGLCLRCAKELGLKPVDDILTKIGITEEDVEKLEHDMEGLIKSGMSLDGTHAGDEDEDAGAPPIDMPRLIRGVGFPIRAGNSRIDEKEHQKDSAKNPAKSVSILMFTQRT